MQAQPPSAPAAHTPAATPAPSTGSPPPCSPNSQHSDAHNNEPAMPVTLFQVCVALIVFLVLTVFMSWCFIKNKPAPTTEEIVAKLLDTKPAHSNLTVAELLERASEHTAPATVTEIAAAIKVPTVEEITAAVIEELGKEDGKLDKVHKVTELIAGATVGTKKDDIEAISLAVWQRIARGVTLGDNSTLSMVQEGDKAIFAIDPPSASPVANK